MKDIIIDYSLRLADTSLILSQRIGEYCSKAPHLEEDLAITNVGLDLLGNAENLLNYAAELSGNIDADELTFKRKEKDFRCLHLVQTPNTDFAFILTRQFLMDVYNNLLFEKLCDSKDETIAGISKKSIKEVRYHLKRSKDWIVRLGQGTDESHLRLQTAIDELWMYTEELFTDNNTDIAIAKEGIGPLNKDLKNQWLDIVKNTLNESNIELPEDIHFTLSYGKNGYHTEYLGYLLAEMQHLPLLYPDAKW
jgi:ring-1,2-phenylacetyl-CoA epoxidase subunit PaaC